MLKRFLAIFVFLACGILAAYGAFFQAAVNGSGGNVNPPAADVVCDVTTGTCSGVGGGSALFTPASCGGIGVDAAPGFRSFNTWAVGTWQASHSGIIRLTVPNGANCQFISATGNANSFGANIKQFQFVANGSTLGDNAGTGGGFCLGGGCLAGVLFTGTDSTVRLETVLAGASCVNLLDVTKISLWSATNYSLISGIDPQGFGDPPNPGIFEWMKVLSTDAVHKCDGVTSGASVTFTAPLAHTYKSTWPGFNVGRPGLNSDQGGPATLYQINQAWDVTQAYYDLTVDQQSAQTNANGRDITFYNLTCPGGFCVIPSQNLYYRVFTWNSPGANTEVDKIVSNLVLQDINIRRLIIQQKSPLDSFLCTNCVVNDTMNGTPGPTTFVGGHIASLSLGVLAYGAAGSFSGTNTQIDAFQLAGAGLDHIDTRGIWSSGTLTVPADFRITGSADNGSGLLRLTVDSTAGWVTNLTTDVSSNTDAPACNGSNVALTVIDGTHFDIQGSTASNNNVSVSIASPAVVTKTSHGFSVDDRVVFGTSGSLPTGITAGTVYWIISAGFGANSFEISTTQGGSAVNTSGSQSGQQFLQCIGSGGILPLTFAVPGGYFYLTVGLGPLGPIFRIDDMSVGANNETILSLSVNGTPYAGGYPVVARTAPASATSHPAPSWSCVGCFGTQEILDINSPSASGLPYGAYVSRTVTAANSGIAVGMPTFGQLSELDMTVTAACSGASNFTMQGPDITGLNNSSGNTTWDPIVNALIASATARKITGTTSSGAQSGDTLSLPAFGADTWMVRRQVLPLYSSVGNCGSASTTITIQTNQGVVYPYLLRRDLGGPANDNRPLGIEDSA